jgi:hypothetical protein
MPRRFDRLLALATALTLPALAQAAHPLVTDDTGTQGKGRSQLEVTGELARDREHAAGVDVLERAGELAATLSIGVHDAVDLVVAAPQAWSRVRENGALVADASGMGDLSVELKARVLERGGFSVAVKPALALPTGSPMAGLGNGRLSYGATVIASQALGRFALHANAAWAHADYELEADRAANHRDVFHGSLAATAAVLPRVVLAANVGVETNPDRASDTALAFAVAGAVWSVTDAVDVDLGVRAGLSAPEADLAALGGVAFRF